MKAWREEMAAMTDKWTNDNHVGTMACQEMEARQKKEGPTSVEMKPEATGEEEVPAEDAEVRPVGEPKKKRRRDRKLAAERLRQEPKDTKRINGGPQEKLAVARRETSHRATVARQNYKRSGKKMSRRATVARRTRDTVAPNMTRHAKVARRKENTVGRNRIRNNQTRNNVARGTPRGQRLQVKTEGGVGMKNEYTRQRLHPGNVSTASRTLRKTQRLDVGQQTVETSSRLQAIKNRTRRIAKGLEIAKQTNTSPVLLRRSKHWTLWRGRPSPKRKKRPKAEEEPVTQKYRPP
jgi:hypothetical protein